jgi:hypothetical protein
LGLVLKRFGKIEDSQRVFTENVIAKGWSTKAWLELQHIYAKNKDIRYHFFNKEHPLDLIGN